MKTFEAHGPLANITGSVASWWFVEGRLQLPDAEANAAARILCRFHTVRILETDDMVVHIWGPKASNDWRSRAQTVARETWPGRALVVRHPDELGTLETDLQQKVDGVLVTDGCEAVVQAYQKAGIPEGRLRYIPTNPTAPDPNRTGSETEHLTRTGVHLEAPDGRPVVARGTEDPPPDVEGQTVAPPEAPAAVDEPELDSGLVTRLLTKAPEEIRHLLTDEEMVGVFTRQLVQAAYDAEMASSDRRPLVLEMFANRLGVKVPEHILAPQVTDPEMTAEKFVVQPVRDIRRALKDEQFISGLSRDFVLRALEAESRKARPRQDVVRKLTTALRAKAA